MIIIPQSHIPKIIPKETTFANDLLLMDAYSNIPKLYKIENITTEEVMDTLDMFQERFGKVDESGWQDIEGIKTDNGTHFNSKDFQEGIYIRGVQLALEAPDHQKNNIQFQVTWKAL